MSKIAVIGAGSWGTALALQLARNPIHVSLWGHLPEDVEKMQAEQQNSAFLPGFAFPRNLQPEISLQLAVENADEILIVVPSRAFSAVARQLAAIVDKEVPVSWATKGLDPADNALLSEVCQSILGTQRSYAVISGPTFALEVAQHLPTAIVIAATRQAHGERLASYLKDERFRPYISDDLIGVQVGGAAKNIMAISAGVCDGLGFGANTRAALITRGLAEITRFGIALGARAETFMGLAGLGDLVLTCTDDKSRNRRCGLALAEGMTVEQAKISIGQEIEGIGTAKEILLKAASINIEMPITEQAYKVLYEGLDPAEAVKVLLAREIRNEAD
ncbi:MAG: NAD(P)-dependent glycerol-3-phosphate dehydrogenase [Gammaproteobacteria bacterium]|nr:NAD(P)-dependent glycerol-3-phosphate dehydrogenase [Gammaproteobacteria bacterium]NNJ92594.1 NAD(P)-dependent glycerol-3-phosphate dehydrogenase [Gammaproteobacteria bacterium]